MKDQELFDLCKHVYEVTNWNGLELPYCFNTANGKVTLNAGHIDDIPLYTSDYLLEKLPKYVTVKKVEYLLVLIPFPGGWIADYYRRYRPLDDFDSSDRLSWLHNAQDAQKCESDIPLKALLKLTLALHEEGLIEDINPKQDDPA